MATLIDDTAEAKKLYGYLKRCRTAVFTNHAGTEYTEYISPPLQEMRLDPDSNKERMYTVIYVSSYSLDVTLAHGIRCTIGSDIWRVTDWDKLEGCTSVIAYRIILEK